MNSISRLKIGICLVAGVLLASCHHGSSSSSDPLDVSTKGLSPEQAIVANFSVADAPGSSSGKVIVDAEGRKWSASALGPFTIEKALAGGCADTVAHLPTADDMDGLAKLLGRDSKLDFHPEYVNTTIVSAIAGGDWRMSGRIFWTSSQSSDGSYVQMNGENGQLVYRDRSPSGDPEYEFYLLCLYP